VVTESRPQTEAERLQHIRDLKDQITELRDESASEVIFQDTSPRPRKVTLYSMTDGQPVQVPAHMAARTMEKRLPGGKYMFTAVQSEAPAFELGEVKCFLHEDSPEQPILAEIGLSHVRCEAAHLANLHSKRIHGLHRHRQEWEAYQEYVNTQKEERMMSRQEKQLEATLEIARHAAGQAVSVAEPPATEICDECGKTGIKNMGAHKAKALGHGGR